MDLDEKANSTNECSFAPVLEEKTGLAERFARTYKSPNYCV